MVLRSALLFFLAGLAEIAGGYFVWIWLRYDAGFMWGVLGPLELPPAGLSVPVVHGRGGCGCHR